MKLLLSRDHSANRRGCFVIALLVLLFAIGVATVVASGKFKVQDNSVSLPPAR